MVQNSGKILIASSRTMVGATNSQVMTRSDRPADTGAVARRSAGTELGMVSTSGWKRAGTIPARPLHCAGTGANPAAIRAIRPSNSVVLAVRFENVLPLFDYVVERALRRAFALNDVDVEVLLAAVEQFGVHRLLPEMPHFEHGLLEAAGVGRALFEVRVVQHHVVAGITAQCPPLLLDFGTREPLQIFLCQILLLRVLDDRHALSAERCRRLAAVRRHREVAGNLAYGRMFADSGEERIPIHRHRHLAAGVGVEVLLHVGIAPARWGAAIVQR